MAKVLGVGSSVLAIVTVALQLSKSSYETITGFRSQRKDVEEIQGDLSALVVVLELVREQAEGSPDDGRLKPLCDPLQCCQTILQEIHDMLEQCTKHSKDHRESVRTWLNLRYRAKSFNDAKQRLSSYKSTLTIAFNSINMRDQQTTQTSLDELGKLTDRTREELEDQLDQVHGQIGRLEASMQATLEIDQKQIQSCLSSLEKAQEVRDTKAQIAVSQNIAVGENARLIAGTDTAQPTFNLSVMYNQAQEGASMAAGVHSPEVLKALLQHRSASPSVVSIVQSIQMGEFNPNSPAVQDLLRQRSQERRSKNAPWRIEESYLLVNKIASRVEEQINTVDKR
ncbi:hypothetical protein LTR51_008618 [Lithohypha guttulata]|nr:hypothetical protein LTR51_008618 [Lithohypha guttulata]